MSIIRNGRIPILDIAKYHSNRSVFVEELRVACHTVGFFLIRHDFGDLARTMLNETEAFFDRPIEQKLSVSYENSPSFRGFMKFGVENTSGRVDCREQVEYAVEYNTTTTATTTRNECDDDRSRKPCSKPFYERLKGKNPWPTDFQPTLEPVTKRYASEVCAVADIIRDSLCLALQLDPKDVIHEKFLPPSNDSDSDEVPHWVIKLVSYPPPKLFSKNTQGNINNTASEPSQHDKDERELEQQGVGAHTDTNFLTLVLQNNSSGAVGNHTGGLQAYSQGEWIDVDLPVPSSAADENSDVGSGSSSGYLICNLGEQAETWSRGYFLATPHRVVTRPSSSPVEPKPRTSVPLFYNPVLSATMGPLDKRLLSKDTVRWDRPEEYQTNQHWRRPNNHMNPSVGENTFKSLARSHPEVFARHHPDLELLEDGRIILRRE